MRRLIWLFIVAVVTPAAANEMSIDQAVSRLLKDIEGEVEVLRVPVPTVGLQSDSKNIKEKMPTAKVVTDGTYRVRRGETLDMIIQRLAPNTSIKIKILRQAFVRANSHAFRRNNPNWLYAGSVLQVPNIDHLRQVIFKKSPNRLKKNIAGVKANWIRFP